MATIIKSISVSLEFHDLAKQHKISWSEAARVGMSLILAEKGVKDYDNNLNLKRRMDKVTHTMQTTIDSLNAEIEELRKKVK